MRMILSIAATLFVASAGAVLLAAEDSKKGIENLAWLEGHWTSEDHGTVWDEHWIAPRGDAMFAVSREVKDGKTKTCELTSLEETTDGIVYRIRHFSRSLEPWKMDANGPLTLKLLSVKDREVVFEDAARDFPRRIVYRREGDALTARLEGEQGGKPQVMAFEFKLAKRR
jgi:hypothetical protein